MKKEDFIPVINNLIISCKKYGELGDKIYDIAGGDLFCSPYSVIYQNFEDSIRDLMIKFDPSYSEDLAYNFCAIILDFAENNQTELANGIDLPSFIISSVTEFIHYFYQPDTIYIEHR